MSFSVNDHSINKKSTWFFDQWSFWHESNIRLVEMIILLIQNRMMIKCYIWNCYVYRRSKASKDQINELLKSLLILEQQWQNISLDFIIDLSESDENNVILTVINRLFKKQHYILCWSNDKEIFAEQTVKLLLIWIFRTHELSRSIVFNHDSQFISIVWNSLCLRLNIKVKLFTNYHSQINDQTERANQNVK